MYPRRVRSAKRLIAAVALAAAASVLGTACSGSSVGVDDYNAGRRSFGAQANKAARAIATRIVDSGVTCVDYQDSSFDPLRNGYVKGHLPLPIGSGECTGGRAKENVLIEMFRASAPNAADFMRRKAELICKKGLKLGRREDGSNDFPGLPYIMAADRTWVVEPDSVRFAHTLARALGRPFKNACTGYKS